MSAGDHPDPAPSAAKDSRLGVVGVLLCTGALYAAVVGFDLSSQSAYWFVHVGKKSLTSATTSKRIVPSLGWQSPIGYDGQYYYFLALDPRHAKDYMEEKAGYIYARPLYPALARAASLGSAKRLPAAMLAVNLAGDRRRDARTRAVAQGAGGYSPWFALLYAAYPGLIFCVVRDLTEPLAFALVALAFLVFDATRSSRVVGERRTLCARRADPRDDAAVRRRRRPRTRAEGSRARRPADRPGRPRPGAAASSSSPPRRCPLLAWREVVGHYVDARRRRTPAARTP